MSKAILCPGLCISVLLYLLHSANGHGSLVLPPSRNAVDRFLPQFINGSWPSGSNGCNCGTSSGCDAGVRASANGQPCLWFSQGCNIGCEECDGKTQHTNVSICGSPMEATLNDPKYRTVNRHAIAGSLNDTFRFNPWRAPGNAPVVDSCGMAGGDVQRGGGVAVFAETPYAKQGDLGSKVLPPAPSGTIWNAGQTVEVAWGIRYNHGGGYQYRLCPAGENLNEECFQKTPLSFVETHQTLQWMNGTRQVITGTFVHEGTYPNGSTWAMNPIPRINFDSVSSGQPAGTTGCDWPAKGTSCRQFDPPCFGDNGWAAVPGENEGSVDVEGICSGDATQVMIVDQVYIPTTLPPGNYVLGWRWDCEETAQIWTNCADIFISS